MGRRDGLVAVLLSGLLLMACDVNHDSGSTNGGPAPETYPLELPPGDYRVCAEVVPRVDVTEVVCTDFSISG